MRVVFVNRFYAPDASATSQMLTDLAVALAARGMDVHVVTGRRGDGDASPLPARERIDGVGVHRVATPANARGALSGRMADALAFHAGASVALLSLLRPGDVVVAKTDPPLVSVAVAAVARLRGARLVNWLQDLFPEVAGRLGVRLAGGASGRLLARLRDASLRAASHNVVIGARMRDRVAATGIDPGRIVTIPNWADGTLLHPVDRAANPLRAKWGVAGRYVVGYSGNLGRAHDFATLLDAADALRAQPDVVFVLVGDGPQREALGAAAVRRGLANVVFRPYQPRTALCLSLGVADAHVVSLRPELEGCIVPSKFCGIAAVGRPTLCIGDPEGEIGTLVRDADCGYATREGDAAGLAAAILALRDDPALAARMGRNARRLFDERFDKPMAVARWVELLDAQPAGTRSR